MLRITMLSILVALALAFSGCSDKGGEKKAEMSPEKAKPTGVSSGDHDRAQEPELAKAEGIPENQPKAAEPEAAEPKAAEPKVEEPKAAEPKVEEPKAAEPKAAEPKAAEPRAAEPKAAEPRAAPAEKTSIEDRRKRVKEIYRLGRSDKAEDLEKLKNVILDDKLPGYERATAVRALGTKPRAAMVDTLKTLMNDKDLAISSEAAITLFQWGEKAIATPKLREMQKMGIALRRAFFQGLKDGEYSYAPEAEQFFNSALDAPQAHVRLDAALGLLHLGQTDTALEHFKKALSTEEKSFVRLTAVSYLASARKVPEVQALLEEAAGDEDAKIAARAKQILSAGKMPKAKPAP